MSATGRLVRGTCIGAALVATAVLAFKMWSDGLPSQFMNRSVPTTAIPMAVLGDSNSHSFQDRIAFPAGSPDRGGALRARTYNWTDALVRLRGKEIDSGPRVVWGTSGVVAAGREAMGLSGDRAPKKEDYLYNFANSGATCSNLMQGRFRQAPRLVALMDREPARWKRGVVVIRIGLNDWAGLLDLQARDPQAPELATVTAHCVDQIQRAITLIHASHPATRILVVGIANEADDAAYHDRFLSATESANITRALRAFNDGLQKLAESSPDTAYFDDDAWFVARWGARNAEGKPNYKTVTIGDGFNVTNSAGDDPHNALLNDHHAGLVWNTLWAQSLVVRLRDAFQLPLTPISDDEVKQFLLPLVRPRP